ncbi:MAG: NADP-dependent phosphogluconate dehydrogenase [Saprospiraceae bacterium]
MIIILTGISGTGKTTLGKALSLTLGGRFFDADSFHSEGAVAKMRAGIALSDADRQPWLARMNAFLRDCPEEAVVLLACSALKERYREALVSGLPPQRVHWVHLQGDPALVRERLLQRRGHFMGAALLDSQVAAYEPPVGGIILDISEDIPTLSGRVKAQLPVVQADLGLMGLGVMGTGLARNLADKGFRLALYNRYLEGKEENVAANAVATYPELHTALAFEDISGFVAVLSRPRIIFLMVEAGDAVDALLEQLLLHLETGDVVVDGGNSFYKDTERRQRQLSGKGIFWIGAGISGGEEGALRGPSIMPGGDKVGFEQVNAIFSAIAAKNERGEPCCAYIGTGGAGHFVKMAHNAIEYAEMQLIAELYAHLRYDRHWEANEVATLLEDWNRGESGSYLLEITCAILRYKDSDGRLLLDKISDQAGNKGTGNWALMTAGELGVPVPSLAAGLFSRYLSTLKAERVALSTLRSATGTLRIPETGILQQAFQFARAMNHLQGLHLVYTASTRYGWQVDLSALLKTWSGGCILRSHLLSVLRADIGSAAGIFDLDLFASLLRTHLHAYQETVACLSGSPQAYPVFGAGLEYAKYLSTGAGNANLIQAQRDYFGAHGYRLSDNPAGPLHHADWQRQQKETP